MSCQSDNSSQAAGSLPSQPSQQKSSICENGENASDPMACLKRLCASSKGIFDDKTQECFCKRNEIFDTASTSDSSCIPIQSDFHTIQFNDSFGNSILTLNRDLGNSTKDYWTDSSNLVQWVNFEDARIQRPLRLSFLYSQRILSQLINPDDVQVYGKLLFSNQFHLIQGLPFSRDAWGNSGFSTDFIFYEPNSKFVLASLGIEFDHLTAGELTDFNSIGTNLPTGDALTPTELALIKAYNQFKKMKTFSPDRTSTLDDAACARYCVRSETINVDTIDTIGTTYTASYKKVYQLGTPSARLIFLQDKESQNVLGIISLNVAESISTINVIIESADDYNGKTSLDYKVDIYDRNWNRIVNQEQDDVGPSTSFDNILK
jgi:hypothetical protein